MEPVLPKKVNHCLGLYTKQNSDLFIDDLSPEELRQIANHMEWYEKDKCSTNTQLYLFP